ncbi:hypothetical protein Tco_0010087 [Tanacetum coccineum]
MTTKAQQISLDNALVASENQCVIGKCNMRINPGMKPKEPTYQVVLDALALTTCYLAFLITAKVLVFYMHQFWATINKHKASYQFKVNNKRFSVNVKEDLAYHIDNKDSKKQDKMFYPRFTKIIIHHFLTKDKSISMRNRTFMHIARDDSLLGTMRFISRHEDTQVYGALLPKAMTNQAMLNSDSYMTYYAIATGAENLRTKKTQKKYNLAISYEETSSKKNHTKAKKDVPLTKKPTTKPKSTKKKAPIKADRSKSLNVLSEVALSEAAQLKEVTKRSKKDVYISHASGLGDGTDFQSGVPGEQQRKISESWGNSREKEDDEDDTEDDEGNDDGNDSDGNDDDNDNDGNDDDDSDHERTKSD